MKKHLPVILISIIFIVGLSLVMYPSISNWYNSQVSSYVVSNYKDALDTVNEEAYEQMMKDAKAYNQNLLQNPKPFTTGEVKDKEYEKTLNVLNGMMGYILIDDLGVKLPIYHGTAESVLQKGVGHLEGTALPTGDVSNHTVLTGHTGLPSAKLFTDLMKMKLGDTFKLHILNEEFVYKVFNIVVVEPQEVDELKPILDKDIVTLVTCTPYGVNSHRLLVQGQQIDPLLTDYAYTEEWFINDGFQEVNVSTNDQGKSERDIVFVVAWALLILILVLVVILLFVRFRYSKTKGKKKRKSRKGGYK